MPKILYSQNILFSRLSTNKANTLILYNIISNYVVLRQNPAIILKKDGVCMFEIMKLLPNNPLYIFIPVLLFIFALIFLGRHGRGFSYKRIAQGIMSPTEKRFFRALERFYGSSYCIFAKMRVADIITPDMKQKDNKTWWSAFSKISQKHFDFILCDPKSLDVLYVLELNDSSHKQRKRAKRDIFLEGACKSAGLPLVWCPASSSYNKKDIDSLLEQADLVLAAGSKKKRK